MVKNSPILLWEWTPLFKEAGINIQIVKSTSCSIGQLLFHNNDTRVSVPDCDVTNCIICACKLNPKSGVAKSTVSGKEYPIDKSLKCNNAGIYLFTGGCIGQYTGKTTGVYNGRTYEHFVSDKNSAIHAHRKKCKKCINIGDCKMQFVESYLQRGNYSLSEREYLWNARFKSAINVQKTLAR